MNQFQLPAQKPASRRPLRTPGSSLATRAKNRRGSALPACLILLPIAMIAFMTTLTQIDIARIATLRREQRAQARLLAESAVHVMWAQPAKKSIEGKIEGAGDYRIDPARREAVGMVTVGSDRAGFNTIKETFGYEIGAANGPSRNLRGSSSITHRAPIPSIPPVASNPAPQLATPTPHHSTLEKAR